MKSRPNAAFALDGAISSWFDFGNQWPAAHEAFFNINTIGWRQPSTIYGVGLFMKTSSGTSVSDQPKERPGILQVLRSGPAIVLEVVWIYLLVWGMFFVARALEP